MNRDQVEGRWKQVTGGVKEQWGKLAGDPFAIAAGRRERLAGRVQQRRGASRARAARELRDFMQRNRNWFASKR